MHKQKDSGNRTIIYLTANIPTAPAQPMRISQYKVIRFQHRAKRFEVKGGMEGDGPHVFIVAGAGAGISTEPGAGDGGSSERGEARRDPRTEKRKQRI